MYLMAQSYLHAVVNFSRPPKPAQNMLYFSLFHQPLQNSKFRENVEILQKQANSMAWLEIPCTMENCGLYIWLYLMVNM